MAMFEYTRLKEAISGWHRQLICRPCKATMHAWTMVTDAPVSVSRCLCEPRLEKIADRLVMEVFRAPGVGSRQ